MKTPYTIMRPKVSPIPIIVSCPHSGTEIPSEIRDGLRPEVAASLDDTDWYVHNLYAFAAEIGATIISAHYSRYVIDLNRNPEGQKLYSDARSETTLVPIRTFHGDRIYKDIEPDTAEISRRVEKYYLPYHKAIAALLQELQSTHKNVLLFDAHSIKRVVLSIRPKPFPDMILGDQLGRTAASTLSAAALKALGEDQKYHVSHNDPFMGGYITRSFGRSAPGIHALQLEMSQDIYMNPENQTRDARKEASVAKLLRSMLLTLAKHLEDLS